MQDGKLLETTEEVTTGQMLFTRFVLDFIEENRERPFFVYYPMVLVHSPFLRTPDTDPEDATAPAKLKHYRDMTRYADKLVGRIVDKLDALGLREDTVLIYTSDNGTGRSLSYPYRDETRKGEKAYPTDGGTHAPLIVSCPGTVKPGTVSSDLVDFSDFLPTLASITGAKLPRRHPRRPQLLAAVPRHSR